MYGIRSLRGKCGKGEDIHDCLQQKEELGGGGGRGIYSEFGFQLWCVLKETDGGTGWQVGKLLWRKEMGTCKISEQC